jgi:hypothetical protein
MVGGNTKFVGNGTTTNTHKHDHQLIASAIFEDWLAHDRLLVHLARDHGFTVEDVAVSVMDLPLGGLFGVDDEWDAGWGRSNEELAQVVREACEEQLCSNSAP